MCRGNAVPQEDSNICSLGILCFHGHWKLAREPILGKNSSTFHCSEQKIQVSLSISMRLPLFSCVAIGILYDLMNKLLPNRVLEEQHATFVETVPFKTITLFTLFQTTYLLVCFGITWIPIAGVLFPLMIMLLVPVRQYFLPKLFKGAHLTDLDAAEYEESPPLAFNLAAVRIVIQYTLRACFRLQFFAYSTKTTTSSRKLRLPRDHTLQKVGKC